MKLKRRNRLQRFWLRVLIAWRLTFQEKHIVVIWIDHDQLYNLANNEPEKIKEFDYSYAGITDVYAKKAILRFADMIDVTELICNEAEYQAAVAEKLNIKE